MRAVVQRVTEADVTVGDRCVGKIGKGFLVLLGVGNADSEIDAQYMADKVARLRVFEDEEGKMNLALKDVGGAVLVVSQFTLYGDARKGNRPSFIDSAPPERAEFLYRFFITALERHDIKVARGEFGAKMKVRLINDGPVTILLDSSKLF
jgi:D-tyrosyl-tRNA(Tyr) deacylase